MFRSLRSKEQGATAIEYGLLAALVAVVIISAVTALGGTLSGVYAKVTDALPGAAGVDLPPPAGRCDADGNYTAPLMWVKATEKIDGNGDVVLNSATGTPAVLLQGQSVNYWGGDTALDPGWTNGTSRWMYFSGGVLPMFQGNAMGDALQNGWQVNHPAESLEEVSFTSIPCSAVRAMFGD